MKTKQGKNQCVPCLSEDCSTACTTFDYKWDENSNAFSDGRCQTDCDCDGLRVCGKSLRCVGVARPSGYYKNPTWYIRTSDGKGGWTFKYYPKYPWVTPPKVPVPEYEMNTDPYYGAPESIVIGTWFIETNYFKSGEIEFGENYMVRYKTYGKNGDKFSS
jgi:hypothetical protein